MTPTELGLDDTPEIRAYLAATISLIDPKTFATVGCYNERHRLRAKAGLSGEQDAKIVQLLQCRKHGKGPR